MSDNEQWSFQFSPKLSDGTLINVRAVDASDFIRKLSALETCAEAIESASKALAGAKGGYVPGAMEKAVETVERAVPGSEVVEENQYHCKHGARVLRTSKPGAPRKWTGYFCPSPQGTADQCRPVFVD